VGDVSLKRLGRLRLDYAGAYAFSYCFLALISRQFVEVSRSRIEGLLAAFPRLVGTGKEHTFVEGESVRYLYQPLEDIFVVVITNKASNILEDLDTLHMFTRVVRGYRYGIGQMHVIEPLLSTRFRTFARLTQKRIF
jgi:hypothetical protein